MMTDIFTLKSYKRINPLCGFPLHRTMVDKEHTKAVPCYACVEPDRWYSETPCLRLEMPKILLLNIPRVTLTGAFSAGSGATTDYFRALSKLGELLQPKLTNISLPLHYTDFQPNQGNPSFGCWPPETLPYRDPSMCIYSGDNWYSETVETELNGTTYTAWARFLFNGPLSTGSPLVLRGAGIFQSFLTPSIIVNGASPVGTGDRYGYQEYCFASGPIEHIDKVAKFPINLKLYTSYPSGYHEFEFPDELVLDGAV